MKETVDKEIAGELELLLKLSGSVSKLNYRTT